ncbi:MAG: hypothetical protein M3R13_10950 [Armatimonadota bacterium]|nr:hypothetical protein [Armatimonadota bacterium]
MPTGARLIASLLFTLLVGPAFCAGSIKLYAKPSVALADGTSTVTIYAEVRGSDGNLVADGTSVRFTTNLGSFREVDVRTSAGTARATLQAPNSAGVARITASAPAIGTINTLDVEFVANRSQIGRAREYVQVDSGESLFYTHDLRLIVASAKERGVSIESGDVRIKATDVQIAVDFMTVTATDAVIQVGREPEIPARFIKYSLATRRGVAIATVNGQTGGYDLAGGKASLKEGGVQPSEFAFEDVGRAITSIHASRIVAFRSQGVQFHNARLYVGNRKLASLPLYKLEPSTPNGLFSEQIIGYSNGGFQLNYPQYLMLSPEISSALRLRSGQDFARGAGGSRGLFLDWENEYRIGSSGEGQIALTGIARKDMGLSWSHSQQFDPATYFSAAVEMPAFRGLYGNLNASRDMGFLNANVSASSARSFSGLDFQSHRVDANLETDMARIGNLPISHSYGLTATTAESSVESVRTSQEGVGLRGRWVLIPQKLWPGGSLNASTSVTQLWGRRETAGLAVLARVGVMSRLWPGATTQLSYNLSEDKLNAPLIGRHRLDGEFFWETEKYRVNLFGAKALDIDSETLFADASYRFSSIWRVGASYSADRFRKNFVDEQTLILAYRIGIREFAITYSLSEGRFGFEIFNVPIR